MLDPNKFHVLTHKGKIFVGFLVFCICIFVLPLVGYVYYDFAINRPSQLGMESTFEIEKGDSLSEISNKLYDNGLINSKVLFYAYTRLNKLDKNIQAGTYRVKAGTNLVDLADLIQHGTNDTAITFLEGWRAEEFARHAAANLKNVDYGTFAELARRYEGYLFPDTYYLNVDVKEQELLDLLLKTFNVRTAELLSNSTLSQAGLSKEQVVIFASIVEREIHTESERPVVAGILIKRWKAGELIGADATTQYVIARSKMGCGSTDATCPTEENVPNVEWWPNNITLEDLENTSPYNTRKVVGLPPAPIASPGLSALSAVVHYKESPYSYYLTDSEGKIYYATTLEEHNANISKHLTN